INSSVATLSSISVTSGMALSSPIANVTLTGTNFEPGSTVVFDGTGVSGAVVSVAGSTSATATFVIAGNAPLGVRNVAVHTSFGNSNTKSFTVLSSAPALTGLTPNSANETASPVTVTVTGTNFVQGQTVVTVSGSSGLTVGSPVTVTTSTSATVQLTIAAGSVVGARHLTVNNGFGTSNSMDFTVSAGPPHLSSVSPNYGIVGQAVNVTLTGSNFNVGLPTISAADNGVTVSNVNVGGSNSITATFTISANAVLGVHNITVTTALGTTSETVPFTVYAPPVITGISPVYGVRGTAVPVTIAGANFGTGFSNVYVSGNGVAVAVNSVSAAVSATFTIAANADLGNHSVTVATAYGTSNAFTFTVYDPPTVSGIAPASGITGQSVDVTISGTNFVAGQTSIDAGAGITVTNIAGSGTTITATFGIDSGATPGSRNVTVSTQSGVSATTTFTVYGVPTLTGAALNMPNTTLSLTGTNFVSGQTTLAFSPAASVDNSAITSVSADGTTITASITLDGSVNPGDSIGVSVTTPGGTTTSQQFTVN
ncbi:MAG TPA: IPT/TIG domain-containing protein, partial [Terriglobia bacterium]|nr:IPT/TIG domain-containing protein [Terriglobia bacterium]